jgi:hypothetical protein
MVLSCSVALWPGRWMPTSITAMQLRIEHGLRLSSYPSTHVVGQFGTPHWFLRLRGDDAETGDDGRFDGYDGVGVVDPRME